MAKEPKLKKEKEEPRMESTAVDTSKEDRLTPPPADLPGGEPQGDYLRKYQYRKQTKPGSVESDPPTGSKAEKMKKFLLSQPVIRMMFPHPMGEDSSIKQSVCLNGYRLDFEKDTYVDVPLQIAEVLGESLKQTNTALLQFRIDGNKEKEKALA